MRVSFGGQSGYEELYDFRYGGKAAGGGRGGHNNVEAPCLLLLLQNPFERGG